MSRAVSLGSLNQDLIGIALSEQNISWQIYRFEKSSEIMIALSGQNTSWQIIRFEKSVEIIILILLKHNMSTSARPGGRGDTAQTSCLTWVGPVCARRVVENEYGGEVGAYGGQVLGVRSKVQRAVLSVVPAHDW